RVRCRMCVGQVNEDGGGLEYRRHPHSLDQRTSDSGSRACRRQHGARPFSAVDVISVVERLRDGAANLLPGALLHGRNGRGRPDQGTSPAGLRPPPRTDSRRAGALCTGATVRGGPVPAHARRVVSAGRPGAGLPAAEACAARRAAAREARDAQGRTGSRRDLATIMSLAPLHGIRACVFDAYGTLFDVAAAARTCSAELGEKSSALSSLWREKQLQYTWLRALQGRHADFWQVTGEALDFALETLRLS